jgi:hypothetical protein
MSVPNGLNRFIKRMYEAIEDDDDDEDSDAPAAKRSRVLPMAPHVKHAIRSANTAKSTLAATEERLVTAFLNLEEQLEHADHCLADTKELLRETDYVTRSDAAHTLDFMLNDATRNNVAAQLSKLKANLTRTTKLITAIQRDYVGNPEDEDGSNNNNNDDDD